MQSAEKTQKELEKKFIEALRNVRNNTETDIEATNNATQLTEHKSESNTVKASKREGENTIPIVSDMTEERNNGIMVAEFIENVSQMLDESKRSKRKKKIGVLFEKHATVINQLMRTINPRFSAEGYELWIDGTGAQHIEIRHGKNGKADSTMATKQAKSLIPWAAQNADGSEFIRDENGNIKCSYRFYNFDGTRAPEIRLEKNALGGVVYVSECVPDSANKRIWITSAYANKKGSKGQLLNIEDKSSPQPTPEASFDSNATTVIIPETSEKSNSSHEISSKKSSKREGETLTARDMILDSLANEGANGNERRSIEAYRKRVERIDSLVKARSAVNRELTETLNDKGSEAAARRSELQVQRKNLSESIARAEAELAKQEGNTYLKKIVTEVMLKRIAIAAERQDMAEVVKYSSEALDLYDRRMNERTKVSRDKN